MPSPPIGFLRIKALLTAIANKGNNDPDFSPHGRFWDVSYREFVDGVVPRVKCNGNPIPIVDKSDPAKSAFLTIISSASGFCGRGQMPSGGPFISDANYSVTLADGSVVPGNQISDEIMSWLGDNFPE